MFAGGDMDEMLRMMAGGGMGGMGGGGGAQRRRKGRDVGHAYPASLEDFFSGKTFQLPRSKTILCRTCKGTGCRKGAQKTVCQVCRGQGFRMAVRQVGPGMMQQMRVPCDACGGKGYQLADKDKCQTCQGKGTEEIEAPLTVNIQKGMSHNDQIPFPGEGDQDPDIDIPGAVVIVLQQLKHDKFERDGDDLHVKHTLTLAEALCGTQFSITQLDGTQLNVDTTGLGPIKPGDKKAMKSCGMPVQGTPGKYGDMVIEFEVTFPSRLETSQVESLRTILPPPASRGKSYDAESAQECYMSQTPLDELRQQMKKDAEDDDDDEGQGGGVRCAQA